MNGSLIFIPVMAVLFYLLLIRPQQRRVRQQQSLLHAIEVGDEIVTIGGIFGHITRVLDDRFEIEVADGTRFYILRSAVGRRMVADNETETVGLEADEEGIE